MKYYTSELRDASVERIVEIHKAYEAYVESIRPFIPDALHFLAREVNFHDYVVERLAVDVAEQSLRLRIHGEMIANVYDVRWFDITYTGVTEFRFESGQPEHPHLAFGKTLEAGNTEIELVSAENKVYEHRWGFVEGSEMIIRFRDVTFINLELPELERNFVQSGILYVEGTEAFTASDYRLAAAKFAEALQRRPDFTPLKFLLAKAKYCLEDFEIAEVLLREVLAEQPKHRGALLYRVRVLADTERWFDLLLFCGEEVRAISGEIELLYVAALAHTGSVDEAETVYQTVRRKTLNRYPELRKEIQAMLHCR